MRDAFFRCDLSGVTAPLRPVWEHTIGSGHAPLALRADWQAQLRRCHEELGVKRVRFHGLLSDDLGTVVRHDARLLYSFFNIDRIWDFLLSIGMQPFVELSFMPEALASGGATVFRYRGNVTPPRRMHEWAELIRRIAAHAAERYGVSTAREWYFEVWNEPNLRSFWRGKREDYFRMYAASVAAIKTVDAELRVGGPATSENGWLPEFLGFCAKSRLPVDFVSTHHYPTDATQDVSSDTIEQLAASRPGRLREEVSRARIEVGDLPLLYTEWNTSSNGRDPLHDEPYAAAFIVKTVLEAQDLVDAYSFWTFTDIFEELYFPSAPFHGGFGLLTLHGVAKPSYRAFQLLHELGSDLVVPVDGIHPTVDCWVARSGKRINVLLTNHALPHHEIQSAQVRVRLDSSRIPKRVTIQRIDEAHANAKRAWLEMGSPEYPTERQIAALHDASSLSHEQLEFTHDADVLAFALGLPVSSVAMVTIE